jgi:hypothetical protein
MTEVECAELRERTEREEAEIERRWPRPTEPACWSWPVTEADRREGRLIQWQQWRCANCGGVDELVCDHDHETGLVRGWLCRSCNGLEPGAFGDDPLVLYRQRNPATMLGVHEQYWSPFTRSAEAERYDRSQLSPERSPAYVLARRFRPSAGRGPVVTDEENA